MPDQSGKLTQDEIKKVHEWLAKYPKGADAPCPICQTSTWWIGEHLVQPVTVAAGFSIRLSGVGYPQIMLISIPCGYTMYINATAAGILPPPPPEPSSDVKKEG